MDDLSQFVPKVYFEQIRIKDLVSNLVQVEIIRSSFDIADTDISLIVLIGYQVFNSDLFEVDLRNKLR